MPRWKRLIRRVRIADYKAQGFPCPEDTLDWDNEYAIWLDKWGDWLEKRRPIISKETWRR